MKEYKSLFLNKRMKLNKINILEYLGSSYVFCSDELTVNQTKQK